MQIAMLGPLEIRMDDGGSADVPGARLRGLLIALALRPGHVVSKASLIDWIWGDNPPADATNALQRLVSRLRKALPAGVIEGHADGYRLAVDPDAVDAVRFERLTTAAHAGARDTQGAPDASQRARLLREALELWRGAAMQDVGLQDSEAFDAAVTRLEGLRLTATEERFDAELAIGHGADLVPELTDLVAAYPMRERLAASLMRALAAAGRDSEALLVYQNTKEALADALGVDPSPDLAAVHVALLRGEARREESRKTNLRAELTSFVGRSSDIATVRELIGEHRLTTVVGPGGSGKTRLAVETARLLLNDLPDGAWLVELAPVGSGAAGSEVAQAALAGLGLRDSLLGEPSHAEPADRFVAAVRERETLLILDNCEHVIDEAAAFAHRVLGECRGLRILATSREPLGIIGEALWPVEPLALPAEDARPSAIEASPAVQLLRDRAHAVRRDIAADARALATMARICRALDGMPLAIELAAARLRTMTIDQLADRLDDRFRLLTGGSRTALPRHRTLRAVIDWSWELLSDAERMVLRRLSAFSNGASLEAAERVCVGEGVEPDHVLELLTALTEKSLVRAEGEGEPRYRMSGTVKEYAAQRLVEAAESHLIRHVHLDYFTELSETAEPHLRRAEQVEWLATLEAEHDNINAAMRGALAAGEAQAAMRLAAASGWYWWLGGHRAEGIEMLTAATTVPGEVTDEVRTTVYGLMVMFVSGGRGDEHSAEDWIRKAHQFAQRSGHRHPGMALIDPLIRMLETPEAALTAFEPTLEDPDPWVRALARLQMGKMRSMLGHSGPEAEAYLTAALAEFRALGERFGISFALTELADRIAMRGEFTAACEYYEQAISVITEVGATEDLIRMRARQASLYWMAGDRDASAAAIAEAERHAERVAWPDALVELALARADLARWAGDNVRAREQLAIVMALQGDEAEQAHVRAETHHLLGFVAGDLDQAREHRAAAYAAATEAGLPLLIAGVLVGIADLALRRDDPERAARLLGASDGLRGLPGRAHPDVARIELEARERLGEERFAEAVREGAEKGWPESVEVTLAS
ncbi:MAG: AfsR family transcriptional regulator [Catenulispora sp. 13_1_20CM_3_70_7]|nr:MAG: AfsR family transcriptional regulator [Catenulispora sp. 13_1_20CM_3_70_7]